MFVVESCPLAKIFRMLGTFPVRNNPFYSLVSLQLLLFTFLVEKKSLPIFRGETVRT